RSQPEYQPERWNPQPVPGCGSVNDNYPAFPLLAQDSISLLAAARVTLYGRINTVKCWTTHKSGIRLSRSVVGLIRDYENRDCDSAIARCCPVLREASCLGIGARHGAAHRGSSEVRGKVTSMARPPPGRGCAGMAAGGAGLRGEGGGVRGSDGGDNGEAKTVTAVAAGGARAEPLERLEQAVNLRGRDDLPGAGHRQDGAGVAGPGGDLDIPARDVVPDGVVDQVGGQLLDQKRVTVEAGGLDVRVDGQAEAADRGGGGGHGFGGGRRAGAGAG